MPQTPRMPRKSGFADTAKPKRMLPIPPFHPGQSCPQRNPGSHERSLGAPLSIRDAASLIGCSPWTVRQKLIPMGLPFFRSGASGKLIFYHDQVVRWIAFRQGDTA